MSKITIGSKVKINNNEFVVTNVLDGYYPNGAKGTFCLCKNGDSTYQFPLEAVELFSSQADILKNKSKLMMVEDKIANAVKGLVSYNSNYVVTYHLGHVSVREISDEDLKFLDSANSRLNKN